MAIMKGAAMSTISLQEAQQNLPDIIHKASAGEVVTITEEGRIVAKLTVEARRPAKQRPGPGLGKGLIKIISDDEEHLKDFEDYV